MTAIWIGLVVMLSAGQAPSPRIAAAPMDARAARALIDQYCVSCHNARTNNPAADPLTLDNADINAPQNSAVVFERVIRKLAVGAMPPQGMPRPDAATLAAFSDYLKTSLDRAAVARNYPGRYVIHRLNRTEYGNAVRDLVGVELDAADLLPSDGGDFGFDNIATALKTSPLLLERYLAVALRVSTMAVGDRTATATATTLTLSREHSQKEHVEGLPLGTRGGGLVRHTFPADGEYVLTARLLRGVEEGYVGVEGWERPNDFIVTVDGNEVYTAQVGGLPDHTVASADVNRSRLMIDGRMIVRVAVTAGMHEIGFTWRDRPVQDQAVWQPSLRDSQEVHFVGGFPRLRTLSIEGPYNVTGVSRTASRDKIFVCTPTAASAEEPCARRILSNLAHRAFRRPAVAADIEAPMAFYREARTSGGDFDAGIRAGVTRVLASPSFLYRIERDPDGVPPGGAHQISDLELASRLSFFLWNSIPDDRLLTLAETGRLRLPSVLAAEVRRMVADERAESMIQSFAGQWLGLRSLESRVAPDIVQFPNFDDNVRQAFRKQTELFFGSVLRDDRPLLELLTANYTFLNERLARHYGQPGVYGERYRRVELTDPHRKGLGLLGQGSVLAMTSIATRTSPTIRGKYILTTLMGLPAPVPPPNVPPLDQSAAQGAVPRTTRERVESHRRNPVCSSCHRNIDPLGFALENFDSTGAWRDNEGANPIDVSGVMSDGTPIDSAGALRNWFVAHPEVFAGNVTERLMIYALGRGLEPNDMPVVRSIVRKAGTADYRFLSVIQGIVESAPFQMRAKPAAPDDSRQARR